MRLLKIWVTFPEHNVNVHLGSQMCKYALCMKGKTQTIKTPSPSEGIQESSIFLATSHFFSVFISSPLSPHPIHQLIRRLIPSPNHKSWMSIFLSFSTIYACFLKLNTLVDAHFFMHGVHLLQHCACIESLVDYKSEVKTPNLICLYCFIFKEHTFSSRQLGNGKDAAGEKESRWGVGDQIKSTASYMAHETVSSSFDPPLTPHKGVLDVGGGVFVCTIVVVEMRMLSSFMKLNLSTRFHLKDDCYKKINRSWHDKKK